MPFRVSDGRQFHQTLIESLINHFGSQDWVAKSCPSCGRTRLSKYSPSLICHKCTPLLPTVSQPTTIPSATEQTPGILRDEFTKYLTDEGSVKVVPPLPIWATRSTLTFVGAGLEVMDGYRLCKSDWPSLPRLVFQPCIRLRNPTDLLNDPRNSPLRFFAFINASLIQPLLLSSDFARGLDRFVTIMSCMGVHASRITLYIDPNRHHFSDLTTTVVRIYVNGVNVGDHVALFPNYGVAPIVETGFGLERFAYCKSQGSYNSFVKSEFANGDMTLLKLAHVLSLVAMSNIPFNRTHLWQKAAALGRLKKLNPNQYDSFGLFSDMFTLWNGFLSDSATKMLAFLLFRNLMEGKSDHV